MNAQLIEAIRQLNLKPGEWSVVEADGHIVVGRGEDEGGTSIYEGLVMLSPWFDSPDPPGTKRVTVACRAPERPLPDPPNLDDLAPGELDDLHEHASDT